MTQEELKECVETLARNIEQLGGANETLKHLPHVGPTIIASAREAFVNALVEIIDHIKCR